MRRYHSEIQCGVVFDGKEHGVGGATIQRGQTVMEVVMGDMSESGAGSLSRFCSN